MRRLLVLTVLGLFLVGCGGSPATDTAADTSGDDTAADGGAAISEPAAGGASASPTAPFGTVTLVDGSSLDGAGYAGDSLALWFWAPW